MKDYLDEDEFFDLMQYYRHMPVVRQLDVSDAFQAVKYHIRRNNGQTRVHSMLESCSNVVIGYLVALVTQLFVFPWFGIHVPFTANLALTACFTVTSMLRGYLLRRWFNRIKS